MVICCEYNKCYKYIAGTLKDGMTILEIESFLTKQKLLRYNGFTNFVHRQCLLKLDNIVNKKVWCDKCVYPTGKKSRRQILYATDIPYMEELIVDINSHFLKDNIWMQWPNGDWICDGCVYKNSILQCDNEGCYYATTINTNPLCSKYLCCFTICSNCKICPCETV